MTSRRRRAATGRGAASLIDRTAGTNIGNMTTNGGLAAAFDGTTNQARANCAKKAFTPNNNSYIGKTVAVPTAIESVTIFGSNDHGYCSNTNPSITITLYGKTGAAPASRTDGTTLGSTTFTDTANESTGRQINSSDVDTYWDHVWIGMSIAANEDLYCGEIQMTGWQ